MRFLWVRLHGKSKAEVIAIGLYLGDALGREPTVSVKVGYEISFTRHFYRPQPLRLLEEIRDDIIEPERETEGLLADIVGGIR